VSSGVGPLAVIIAARRRCGAIDGGRTQRGVTREEEEEVGLKFEAVTAAQFLKKWRCCTFG